MWIDAHCHIQTEYAGGSDISDVIQRAREAQVETLVCVGTDLASSLQAIEVAQHHDNVFATVGLHPHDAKQFDAEWNDLVAAARASTRVVAIGEAGYDLYYEHSPLEDQRIAFEAQIELARELDLALVIHTRDAWDHTFASLERVGVPQRTVIHCFSGGPIEAQRALALGCWLSFSGIVSFKAADALREAAALTPSEKLLVETDAPFLAPVPYRGKTNEPAYLPAVGAALAAARGVSEAEIAALTSQNAVEVFRLAR